MSSNEGTHLHNVKVLEQGVGQLLVQRCPVNGVVDPRNYWPCNLFLIWYVKAQYRHQKCSKATTEKRPSKKLFIEIVTVAEIGATEAMAKVLSSLLEDEAGKVIRGNHLLQEYLPCQQELFLQQERKPGQSK